MDTGVLLEQIVPLCERHIRKLLWVTLKLQDTTSNCKSSENNATIKPTNQMADVSRVEKSHERMPYPTCSNPTQTELHSTHKNFGPNFLRSCPNKVTSWYVHTGAKARVKLQSPHTSFNTASLHPQVAEFWLQICVISLLSLIFLKFSPWFSAVTLKVPKLLPNSPSVFSSSALDMPEFFASFGDSLSFSILSMSSMTQFSSFSFLHVPLSMHWEPSDCGQTSDNLIGQKMYWSCVKNFRAELAGNSSVMKRLQSFFLRNYSVELLNV